MSLHNIPSIDRQMYRRAKRNVELERMLKSIMKESEETEETETENKDSDYNRFVSKSGVRYDFAGELNKILQKRLEENFENNLFSSGTSFGYFGNSFYPWDFLK